MKALVPAAVAAWLAACAGSDTAPAPRPIASVADPSALAPQKPEAKPSASPAADSHRELPPPPRELKPIPSDPSRKFEIVDLTIDTRDPNSMRRLVPYLLRSEEWMILKVEWTSPTVRHYRFRRIAPPKDASLMPDPLAPRRGS